MKLTSTGSLAPRAPRSAATASATEFIVAIRRRSAAERLRAPEREPRRDPAPLELGPERGVQENDLSAREARCERVLRDGRGHRRGGLPSASGGVSLPRRLRPAG